MHRSVALCPLVSAVCLTLLPALASAEPPTLMQMVAEWRYPDSEFHGAQASDGETVDAGGKRTTPSIVCKTVMTTDAPIETVLNYYKTKLTRTPDGVHDQPAVDPALGRSVVFSDDSEGRPFAMHTILVNTHDTSTTLIITRGTTESRTHISWKHYRRFAP